MSFANSELCDHIMTNLAEHGFAIYSDDNAEWGSPAWQYATEAEIREVCREEGVQVRFYHGGNHMKVSLRKVGRGH